MADTSDRPASISRVARAIEVAAKSNPNRYRDDPFGLSAEAALEAISPDERPTAAMLAAGMSAWEATAGTREDMLRNAYVAMNEYRLSTTKADHQALSPDERLIEALEALEAENESRTERARTDRELGVAGGVALTLRQIRQRITLLEGRRMNDIERAVRDARATLTKTATTRISNDEIVIPRAFYNSVVRNLDFAIDAILSTTKADQ